MVKKVEKSIPWIIILAIGITVFSGAGMVLREVRASTATRSATIENTSPSVGTVILNGGSDITLTENTTATVSATTTVTDVDGYSDVSSVIGKLFRSGVGTSCSANDNNCYSDSACATSSCSGNSCTATCEHDVWFHGDPTDAGTWESENWDAWIKAIDIDNASSSATSTGVEVNTLRALDLSTSTIGYGILNPGSTTGSVNQTTTITDTGNEAIDIYLYGTDMESGANNIPVREQRYSTSSFDYDSYEDLTTYTEVDPENHITTTTSRVTHESWQDEDAYLYDDKGVAYFDDFEHLVTMYIDTGSNNRFKIYWSLANALDDWWGLASANETIITIRSIIQIPPKLRLLENFGGSEWYDTYNAALDTPYYLRIKKNDTDLTCEIYSDAGRSILLDTLSLTLHADHTFRYIYAAQSFNSGVAQSHTGWSENFDIEGSGTKLTSVTSTEVEIDLSKPTAHSPNTSTDDIYWGMRAPSSPLAAGTYTGTTTFEAKSD